MQIKTNMDMAGPKRPRKGCTQRTSKELNPSKDLQKKWTQKTKKRFYILAYIGRIKEWPISIGAISGLLMTGCKGFKGS